MNSTFNYHYSLNDAERWAEFSGDYNPIHFDLQQAQHLGQVQLTVHGMRAMLDIKYQLSTALLPLLPGGEFLRFNARLRQPVQCHTSYQLQLSEAAGQVSGNLIDICSGESCLPASCAVRQHWCKRALNGFLYLRMTYSSSASNSWVMHHNRLNVGAFLMPYCSNCWSLRRKHWQRSNKYYRGLKLKL